MNPQEIIAELIEQIRGMWRYRWQAMGIAWLLSVSGWFYVYSLPNIYQASAQVFVDTNSLLGPLMQGLTAQQNPLDEVQLVSKAVLTRPNLEEVAYQTDMALAAETPEDLEMLISDLQERIQVTGGGRDNIFTIGYEDTSHERSVAIVAAILDTFVSNAIGNQGDDAEITERALSSEIRTHEERLTAAESALAQFKRNNLGYMPGESGGYYERLQQTLDELKEIEEEARLVTEQRDELRRQLEGEEPVVGIMSGPVMQTSGCRHAAQLTELASQLAALRVDYTERHPRMLALQETIQTLEAQCASSEPSSQLLMGATSAGSSNSLQTNPVYQSMRIQLSEADVRLASLRADLLNRQADVAELRRDVDQIVEVERQLKQLNRDYEVVQARHQELLRRWEDLQAKKRLDPVTDEVRFRHIEPPFALTDPVGPNRPLLILAILVFAIGVGLVFAFGLNQINPAFFSIRGLRSSVDLPVLGTIRLMPTPEMAAEERIQNIMWISGSVLLFAGTILAVVFADPGSELLRKSLEGIAA